MASQDYTKQFTPVKPDNSEDILRWLRKKCNNQDDVDAQFVEDVAICDTW